jgi:hypothetical protein
MQDQLHRAPRVPLPIPIMYRRTGEDISFQSTALFYPPVDRVGLMGSVHPVSGVVPTPEGSSILALTSDDDGDYSLDIRTHSGLTP